jgi:hypothetical protein
MNRKISMAGIVSMTLVFGMMIAGYTTVVQPPSVGEIIADGAVGLFGTLILIGGLLGAIFLIYKIIKAILDHFK